MILRIIHHAAMTANMTAIVFGLFTAAWKQSVSALPPRNDPRVRLRLKKFVPMLIVSAR